MRNFVQEALALDSVSGMLSSIRAQFTKFDPGNGTEARGKSCWKQVATHTTAALSIRVRLKCASMLLANRKFVNIVNHSLRSLLNRKGWRTPPYALTLITLPAISFLMNDLMFAWTLGIPSRYSSHSVTANLVGDALDLALKLYY